MRSLGRQTWLVDMNGRAIVAKRMSQHHSAEWFREAMTWVRAAGIPAPPLLDVIDTGAGRFALYPFVAGAPIALGTAAWRAAWIDALTWVTTLSATRPTRGPAVDDEWLERVGSLAAADPAAAAAIAFLKRHPPTGTLSMAHGDLAPQNIIDSGDGFALIDWEETGLSRPGFDAGWLLALNRIGAGPRMNQASLIDVLARLPIPFENLIWFEGLALLRLQWRATALASERPAMRPVLDLIRAAVARFVTSHVSPHWISAPCGAL